MGVAWGCGSEGHPVHRLFRQVLERCLTHGRDGQWTLIPILYPTLIPGPWEREARGRNVSFFPIGCWTQLLFSLRDPSMEQWEDLVLWESWKIRVKGTSQFIWDPSSSLHTGKLGEEGRRLAEGSLVNAMPSAGQALALLHSPKASKVLSFSAWKPEHRYKVNRIKKWAPLRRTAYTDTPPFSKWS